jgi:hypothetical protein
MLKQTIWKTTCAPKTSRFGRLITDWLVENMSPDMTINREAVYEKYKLFQTRLYKYTLFKN